MLGRMGEKKKKDLTHLPPSNTLKDRMNEMMEAIERWMERFMMDHDPSPIRNQEFRVHLCVDQAQTAP